MTSTLLMVCIGSFNFFVNYWFLFFYICLASHILVWIEKYDGESIQSSQLKHGQIYLVVFWVEVFRKLDHWHHQVLTTFDVRQGEQQKGNISNFTKHCRFLKHTSDITKSLHIQLIFTSHKTFVCFWQIRMRAFTKYFLFTLH